MEDYTIEVGDWVKTNYGTGPYIVRRIGVSPPEWYPKAPTPSYDLRVIHVERWVENRERELPGDDQYSYLNAYHPEAECWRSGNGKDEIIKISKPDGVRGDKQLSLF